MFTAARDLLLGRDLQHGPLPLLLPSLSVVTGLVDAVSYLSLDHVFVANMTGNVVFLGFATGGARDFSIPASLLAIAAFLLGALAGGGLASRQGGHRGRFIALVILAEFILAGIAMITTFAAGDPPGPAVRLGLIVPLPLAMGIQNAAARRLAVPDLTTTVLTLTLTGLAADSHIAGGKSANWLRRIAAVVAMFAGAGIGAGVVLRFGVAASLAVTCGMLAVLGALAFRYRAATAPWVAGARPS